MPTTSPRALNSGPPELPGFTATSVWMKGTRLSSGSERPLALTTPAVTLFSKPKGGADGQHPFAHLQVARAAQAHGGQILGVDLEHGHVGLGVGAQHLGAELA